MATEPSPPDPLLKRSRPLLGTFVEIAVGTHPPEAHAAIDAAFAEIARLHELLSFHSPHSELSRLNLAGSRGMSPSPLTLRVLRLAKLIGRLSGGRFNCTVGGRLVRAGILPDHGFREFLETGTPDDVEIDGNVCRLRRPVLVTLDGIAKGFAVDRAIRALKRHGIAAGSVNAGGDLRVFGELAIPIHLRLPDAPPRFLGFLKQAAMASSTTDHDPGFPGMIVAPGNPSPQPGPWTVIATSTWRADALTKVAAACEDHERHALLASLGGRLIHP